MAKFDSQFRLTSDLGQRAVAQIATLKVGDVLTGRLMPAIPEDIKWKCIEAQRNMGGKQGADIVTLVGRWCDIPLYTVEIRVEDDQISLKVREV